jgi:hypothetical protein
MKKILFLFSFIFNINFIFSINSEEEETPPFFQSTLSYPRYRYAHLLQVMRDVVSPPLGSHLVPDAFRALKQKVYRDGLQLFFSLLKFKFLKQDESQKFDMQCEFFFDSCFKDFFGSDKYDVESNVVFDKSDDNSSVVNELFKDKVGFNAQDNVELCKLIKKLKRCDGKHEGFYQKKEIDKMECFNDIVNDDRIKWIAAHLFSKFLLNTDSLKEIKLEDSLIK